MSDDEVRAESRRWIVGAIEATPGLQLPEETWARLRDPAGDCGFREIGMDSLAMMEFCINIECETNVALSVGDVERCGGVNALAVFLGSRIAADAS